MKIGILSSVEKRGEALITREDLERHGFACVEDTGWEEIWESLHSPSGQWIEAYMNGGFRGAKYDFSLHTVLTHEQIAEPVDLGAAMRGMGIPTGRAD